MGYTAYVDTIPLRNRVARLIWGVVWALLFRPFVGRPFRYWRVFLLLCFGAKIGKRCSIYANTHIWAPWNLTLGDYVAIGPGVQLYTVNKITIGSMVTISQRAYLCTASHDITKLLKPLIHRPIVIGDYAWVAAEAFVGMGTTIGEGAIVAARAVVVKDAPPLDRRRRQPRPPRQTPYHHPLTHTAHTSSRNLLFVAF